MYICIYIYIYMYPESRRREVCGRGVRRLEAACLPRGGEGECIGIGIGYMYRIGIGTGIGVCICVCVGMGGCATQEAVPNLSNICQNRYQPIS